ncbi:GRAM domain-containing protein 2B-like [Menidia menidia]
MKGREETIPEENLERSDGFIRDHSFLKHSKAFHKFFEEIPEDESLTHVFTCALQKEVLYHGKLFISERHMCFHSSVLLKDTKVVIPVSTVKEIKKHNSALSMLSIQTSSGEKYLFVSLRNREKCYKLLQAVCSHTQEGSPNSSPHLSSAENEADHDMLSSYSSLEDSIDNDLGGIYHGDLPQMSSQVPRRDASDRQSLGYEDHRDESRIGSVTKKVMPLSAFREIKDLRIVFYIFMMLVVLLLLVSGYIGLRITALEEQLDSLGALPEWSSN